MISPDELRVWITTHGYTQKAFADRCKIDERRLRSWLAGERRMPILMPIVLELLELLEVGARTNREP